MRIACESVLQESLVARTRRHRKLGEILIEQGVVSEEAMNEADGVARSTGKRLGEALVESGAATDRQIAEALGVQSGLEFVDLDKPEGSSRVDMALVPDDIIRKHMVLPLTNEDGGITLLIHDPMDLELLDLLRFRLNSEIETAIGVKSQMQAFVDNGGSAELGSESFVPDSIDSTIDSSMDNSVDKSVDASIDVDAGDSGIVSLVNNFIMDGVRARASDIHVEPTANDVLLRYRIDGVCQVRGRFTLRQKSAILARLKLMSGVNISERRIPQDGRIKLPIDGEQIDFRVSTCPAYHGESVVLRVLRPDSVRIGLPNLGFEPDNLDVFNKIIRRPNGIFLVTGPTGSGKTTTLYSALNVLNTPDKKIITAEDPVEYNFDGINQVQVREGIGLTFGSILKAMLRQAPNVVLVGEIRDREVGDIAIQAALTGHLVFSTLHTNDAPSAITRLVDMGIKPFLVASSIQAIMAQRLIRVLCNKCKQPDDNPDRKALRLVNITDDEVQVGNIMRPVGCTECNGSGFRGRKAIFELMIMNSEIRELAFQRGSISKLRDAAIRGGMRSLLGDGKIKILDGTTTPDEIAKFAQIEGFNPNEIEA
jgi:type IV pilus assembly protein PilB